MVSGWNDERIERLKTLWADGWSAAQIANDLGDVSRSGVLGKVHRLGLSSRTKLNRRPLPAPARVAPDFKSGLPLSAARLRATAFPRYFEPAAPYTQLPLPLIPPAERKSILDLEDNDCRFPCSGDAKPHMFCGREKVKGAPYCEPHMRIAYVPVPPRRQAPVAPSTAPDVIRIRLVEKVA